MSVNQDFILEPVLNMLFALFCRYDENPILPVGFHFRPNHEELIGAISCKITGLELPFGRHLQELDVYEYSPRELSEMYSLDEYGDNVYFMTPRRRGPSEQFVRDVGYWKPIRNGTPVMRIESASGRAIGWMRIHHFFKAADDGNHHEWVMKEYIRKRSDDWVIVKISRKTIRG